MSGYVRFGQISTVYLGIGQVSTVCVRLGQVWSVYFRFFRLSYYVRLCHVMSV